MANSSPSFKIHKWLIKVFFRKPAGLDEKNGFLFKSSQIDAPNVFFLLLFQWLFQMFKSYIIIRLWLIQLLSISLHTYLELCYHGTDISVLITDGFYIGSKLSLDKCDKDIISDVFLWIYPAFPEAWTSFQRTRSFRQAQTLLAEARVATLLAKGSQSWIFLSPIEWNFFNSSTFFLVSIWLLMFLWLLIFLPLDVIISCHSLTAVECFLSIISLLGCFNITGYGCPTRS